MGFCLCFVGLGPVLWVFVIVVMLFLNFFFAFTGTHRLYMIFCHFHRGQKERATFSGLIEMLL